MSNQYFKIVILVLWFLLPIVPAFILYKFLPKNRSVVQGPFKGLKIDMAGAFAGYFLLFIIAHFIIKGLIFSDREYEVWTVKGIVKDENNSQIDFNRNKPEVSILPSAEIRNGVFDFQIPVRVDGSHYDFPILNITAISGGADRASLFVSSEQNSDFFDLDVEKGGTNGNWKYNFEKRILKYQKPITLVKASAGDVEMVGVVNVGQNEIEIDSIAHQ